MLEISNTKTIHKQNTNITFLIEHYIEEHSGEYNSKTIYADFSKKITLDEFNHIIKELVNSGKIAIDREGIVCWTWNPELVKKIQTDKKFAARWTR